MWPDFIGSGCEGDSARFMLNLILLKTAQHPGDPQWSMIRAAAMLCRANEDHGLHAATLSDQGRYDWTCQAYERARGDFGDPPDLVLLLREVDHGGGGGGVSG